MVSPIKNLACTNLSTASNSAVSCPPSPSRANLYAQELNNSAALCIEAAGLFDRAIVSLKRALKLYKYQQKTQRVVPCNYYEYTLEGCIIGTRELKRTPLQDDSIPCDSFISKQPILVPARGRTTMGPALLLVIAHNLGLAHHLVALGCEGSQRKDNVRSAMASYNIAYQTQTSLIEHQPIDRNEVETAAIRSNQFKMIIINNMSHLHKLNTDAMKHDHCLRMLLPIIMLVVDQQGRTANTTEKSSSPIELQGFLRNISPLILRPKYTADTA